MISFTKAVYGRQRKLVTFLIDECDILIDQVDSNSKSALDVAKALCFDDIADLIVNSIKSEV